MPKKSNRSIIWLTVASVLLLLAIWQAQVVLKTGDRPRQKLPGPPVKTRHAMREPMPVPGDPVATFIARAEKGLTDRQIGWIVGDFQNAGLDLGIRVAPSVGYLAQRKAQDRWYRDALVEGLSLDSAQSAEMTVKLAQIFKQAKEGFERDLAAASAPFEHEGKNYQVVSATPIHGLIDVYGKLPDEKSPLMPEKLCKLPPEWMVPAPAPDRPKLPGPEVAPVPFPVRSADLRTRLVRVDFLLPLIRKVSPSPFRAPADDSQLALIRTLHPARLKLLLLLDPALAVSLQRELDAASP